jgi:hypothetical protein
MLLPAQFLALLLSAAGLLCLVPALLRRASWGVSVGMMLDLWTAASLLRLSSEGTSWRALIIAALLVALRYLVAWSLRTGPWGRWHGARPLSSWSGRWGRPSP